jgi:hypothetical protein
MKNIVEFLSVVDNPIEILSGHLNTSQKRYSLSNFAWNIRAVLVG